MGTNSIDKIPANLKKATQQKVVNCAKDLDLSPDVLLNILLDDEIERQRLLSISKELEQEEPKNTTPSQKIAQICNQHLSKLTHESEKIGD